MDARLDLFLGLSPRIRGNQEGFPDGPRCSGSIPAHTGKPRSSAATPRRRKVYPRAYGETDPDYAVATLAEGLSPRIRGNPRPTTAAAQMRGSIPAHTGKPRSRPTRTGPGWVYPRAYGETWHCRMNARVMKGLSPRIRGNLALSHECARPQGSIPAHTGKPAIRFARRCRRRVYPRAYGETGGVLRPDLRDEGLSPRIRGNPCGGLPCPPECGSIPAHTGKPAPCVPK